MKDTLSNILKVVFIITLSGFIIFGIVMVLAQLIAVITQSGNIAIQAKELMRLPAIRMSVICAFSAFFYRYTSKTKKELE